MKTVGVILAILIVLLTIYTSGCQTVKGVCRDGYWITDRTQKALESGDEDLNFGN